MSTLLDIGDDPALAADEVPLPTTDALPLTSGADSYSFDPLTTVIADPSNSTPLVYGPTLAQLGATPSTPGISGSSDPSAINAHPSTAPQTAPTILDDILGISKLGLGITSAVASRGTSVTNPTLQSNKVATAKSPTSGAGTSTTLVFLAIAFFVGLFLWAELKH